MRYQELPVLSISEVHPAVSTKGFGADLAIQAAHPCNPLRLLEGSHCESFLTPDLTELLTPKL